MRTIRRVSLKLNRSKWKRLVELVHSYAQEKDIHLLCFGNDASFAGCGLERSRRDLLVRQGYTSPTGLQARAWKMAHKDAYETLVKHWASIEADLRPKIAQHAKWSEAMKHYAYWLIDSPHRLAHLCAHHAPVPSHFEISDAEQRTVRNLIRRVIRRRRGRRPRVKIARSMCLDANMYTVFVQDGTQYIKVMSRNYGKRIVIPLTGNTPIMGNIRLVLDPTQKGVEIHYTADVKKVPRRTGDICALDAGVSEVFTDEYGNPYGENFGTTLAQISRKIHQKGQARNKLYQIAQKAEELGDQKKARRIRKFNLSNKKQQQNRRKKRQELARQINTAIHQVIIHRKPSVIVTEKLDIRGKAKSKKLSRRVSYWTRRILNERVDFKASAGGSRREQVNPAYSSQTCPP